MLKLHVDNPISQPRLIAIEKMITQHKTLEDIINWTFQQAPSLSIDNMISQDEFSIDVVVRYDVDLYLVYGVT